MTDQLVNETPLEIEQARSSMLDRLKSLPVSAREHAGKLAGAALAGLGIGLIAVGLPAEDVGVHVAAAEASPVSDGENKDAKSAESARITGYWMLSGHGFVMSFGNAEYHGSGPDDSVGIASTPHGKGYWIVKPNGVVLPYGDASLYANAPGIDRSRGEEITTIASTPGEEEGFWTASSLGRVFSYGNAHHYGDMSGTSLNQPVVKMIPTPSGHGYWLLGADGGVFSFGDAQFHGSTGDKRLNSPVVDIIPDTSDNDGYWLLAGDGGVFSFDADFHGSTGDMTLNQPVVGGMPSAGAYDFFARDGGWFKFSKGDFLGSGADNPNAFPVVAAAIKKN
jgi:hypothetical protein